MLRPKRCKVEYLVTDYIQSKNATQKSYAKEMWPLLELPEIDCNRQRRLLIDTEEELEKRKQLYIEERKILDEQWGKIRSEGEHFKSNFIKFNEFLHVNLEKRRRAKANIKESTKFRTKVEDDVEKLIVNIASLKKSRAELDLKIRDHNIFEKFLGQVINFCGKEEGFKNEFDIVERYEYYAELSVQLGQQQEKIFAQLQHAKTEMSKLTETSSNILLGLRTQSIALQGRYEEAARKSRHLENLIMRIRDAMRQRMEDVELVKSATWNLYLLICRRKNETPKCRKSNIEEQLLIIKQTLKHLAYTAEQLMNKLKPSKSKKKLVNLIGQ